jgi:hypothetical protein
MFQGKTAIKRCTQQNFHKTTDIKSRLEDVILGQGSARSEMMMRRKGIAIKNTKFMIQNPQSFKDGI